MAWLTHPSCACFLSAASTSQASWPWDLLSAPELLLLWQCYFNAIPSVSHLSSYNETPMNNDLIAGVWDCTIKAKHINLNSLAYAVAGISIVLDIIVLILLIPQFLGLKSNTVWEGRSASYFYLVSKDCWVSLIPSDASKLTDGIHRTCIASIVQLKYIVNFSNSVDQTYKLALIPSFSLVN